MLGFGCEGKVRHVIHLKDVKIPYGLAGARDVVAREPCPCLGRPSRESSIRDAVGTYNWITTSSSPDIDNYNNAQRTGISIDIDYLLPRVDDSAKTLGGK